jgi:Kef-type K+ transport system membrane component KefB
MEESPGGGTGRGSLRRTWAYGALLAGTVVLFLWIREVGTAAELAPGASAVAPAAPSSVRAAAPLLLALLVVLAAARLVGRVFRGIGQPPVVGEMLAGILLGPSLLGALAPEVSAFLFPPSALRLLEALAQVGVVLYMFLVGLELDTTLLRDRRRASVAISHASIVAPFLLGAALALWLHPTLAPPGVPFTVFALFLGAAMSVTAFPVLARILADRGLLRTPTGATTLACAAVDDVSAWCLLALVVGVAKSDAASAAGTVAGSAAFVAFVLLVVRPLVRRVVARAGADTTPQGTMAVVCLAVLAAAVATEAIGIHALFGGFLLGAIVPHDAPVARDVRGKLEDVVLVLLLPAFFALTGMRTEVGLLAGPWEWGVCAAVVAVASLGKFGGTFVAARLTGHPARESAILGVLMNTRGLMEVVVLNVGLDLGVVSPTLFTMLVIMALVTTLATTPIVHALRLRGAGAPAPAVGGAAAAAE